MHQPLSVSFVSVCASILILLAACATRGPVQPPPSRQQGQAPSQVYKPGDIVETATGRTIPFETLMDELSRVAVIYVGEMHTSIEDHRIQLKILQGLHERNPSLTLGMEMFPREAQPVLDRYSLGSMSEEAFLEEVRWQEVWGYPFQLYRRLLTFARDERLDILGLNAPSEVVRKVSRTGLASLTPEERGRIARDFHFDDPKHRQYVREEYEQHAKEHIRDFETFYESQLTWEETMAETLAGKLSSQGAGEQILVLVGKGHISSHVGIPQLTLERVAHTHKTVIPVPVRESAEDIGAGVGDYVWVTERSEPFHRGRLGVAIKQPQAGEGLEIMSVVPESPAEKAGVKAGDVLLMIDGKVIKNLEELHKAVASENPVHDLILKREGQEISVTVTISP